MIQVYSQSHERQSLLEGYKNLAVKKKLADGDKTLTFQYPRNGAAAKFLVNECYIRTQEDEFVLKEISGGAKWRKYTAQLNLEELEGKSFVSFETVEKTVAECLTAAFDGTGWSIGTCEITKRRTIRKTNVCTAVDIVEQCISTYKCEVVYHSITKKIDIYEKVGSDRGTYFMEGLNLRKPPTYSQTSEGLYTQLRPVGKDGLMIDVNGKNYIENHSYSPKNIMMTWKDERYTKVASLLEDAVLKLQEVCRPTVTYEADIIDLAKTSEIYKDILDYGIGDIVTLTSKSDGIKEKMRIAVITEYPESPQSNTCQLSTAKKTFADVQQEVIDEAVAEATASAAVNTSETVDNESSVTSEEIQLEVEGMKTEILKVVSEEYLTEVEGKKAAQDAAVAAVSSKMEDYVTSTQQTREIDAAKKSVLQTVSQTYATTQQMKDTQTTTLQSVNDAVDGMEQKVEQTEESKHDYIDTDGTIWRMGVQGGRIFIEEIEAEG